MTRFPALKSIAAATVVAFAVTTMLPAGWAWAAPARDTMRVIQPEQDDSPVKAGLEEALRRDDPATRPAPSLTDQEVAARTQFAEERAAIAKAARPRRSFWHHAAQPMRRLTVLGAIALQLLGVRSLTAPAQGVGPPLAAPHPGLIMKVDITGSDTTNAVTATATQTATGRVLETPRDFARDPLRAAGQHLTDTVAAIRNRGRQAVFGSEDARRWTAATTPERALLLPDTDVGYTVWNPESLGRLGQDRVNALYAAIGRGAQMTTNAHARFLWEVQYMATLKGADGKPHPSADVLRDVQQHLAMARQHGMDLWAMYSGTEGLGDPDIIVQLFQIAKDQGFHQFITDLEPWKEPGGAWARAWKALTEAEARRDATAISTNRRALLGEAGKWFAAHETLVQRVIQPDHAAPEGITPALHALVATNFVPFLRTAVLWQQIDRAVAAQQAAKDPTRLEAARLAARQVFETHTAENPSWTLASLQQALATAGYRLDPRVFIPTLPDGLKLVVMAYDYPAGAPPVQIAAAVAAQMRWAATNGFNTPLGLAINVEPGSVDPTLADRSAQAGEIAKAIVGRLRTDSSTGYDGETLVVHVAGELDLVDLAKDGALSPARRVTPAQAQRLWRMLETAVKTLAGKTPMSPAEQHLIPIPRTMQGWWQTQARESARGLATGIVGLEPVYANLFENPKQWFNGRPVVHLGTGVAGPEGGMSVKWLRYLTGGLTSDQARVVEARLRLIKRSPDGRVLKEQIVPSILGQDIPEISDAVWDEGELEITLRRDSHGPALPLGIAVRVANPHAGAGETPRDVWKAAAIAAGETTGTVTIPLPPIMPGANAVTLLTHDEDNAIVEWIGPGQNPRYLAIAAPSIADRAARRLEAAKILLPAIRGQLGVPPGAPLTGTQLKPLTYEVLDALRKARGVSEVFSRHDLLVAQVVLETSSLAAETAGRVEVLAWHTLGTLPPSQVERHLEELKRRNVTAIVVRAPNFERDLHTALTSLTDQGVSDAAGWFRRAPYAQIPALSKAAHALGLKMYVAVEAAPLFERATALGQAAHQNGQPFDALTDLLRLAVEVSEMDVSGQRWTIDGMALVHPVGAQRRQVERVLPGTFNLTMLTIGSDLTPSSESSLGITPVTLGRDPAAVREAVRRAVDQPQPVSPKQQRLPAGILLRVEGEGAPLTQTTAWLSDPTHLPAAADDPKVLEQVLARLRVPRQATLERLGYPTAVIQEALTKAPTLTQEQLTEALKPDTGAAEPWADALVASLAAEWRGISETPQLFRTGTPLEQAIAWLFGIQVSPLVIAEPPRVEITPLMTKHVRQADGTAWLGVQVTNPADPAVATAPAVYDVELYIDYTSWPAPVREVGTLTLKPGETVPALFQVTGLPRHEDSRLVKVRVLPRSAEGFLAGQMATRNDAQQALEVAGCVIHHADGRPTSVTREFEDQMKDFQDHEKYYRLVHGIPDPATMSEAERQEHDKGYERRLRAWFGEGTPLQRADVTVVNDPATQRPVLNVTLRTADLQPTAAQESGRIRQAVERRATELLAWTRPVEDAGGIRGRTWFYTVIGFLGFFGAVVGYAVGMLKGYRRAGAARRYREELDQEAADIRATSPEFVSVTGEQMIRIEGIAADFKTSPARLDAEQGKVPMALKAYDKHWIGVVDVATEMASQNIERTPVDPLRRAEPDQATLAEQAAVFIRAAPRLLFGGALAAVGGLAAAVVVGTPLAWVLGPLVAVTGVVVAAWTWTRRTTDQQAAAGWWLMWPARVAAGPVANHPVTIGVIGAAALAAAVVVGLAFHLTVLPWMAAATITAVWFGVIANLADPAPGRLLGALGFSALGAVLLTGLWGATLPIWGGWVALSVATVLITQRLLMTWLTADQPMQRLLEGTWSAARFAIKWGAIAAVVYGFVTVAHPFLWAGGTLFGFTWVGVSAWPAWMTVPVVGGILAGNAVHQWRLLQHYREEQGITRRDHASFLINGLGAPAAVAVGMWWWPLAPAVLTYVMGGILAWQGLSWGLAWGVRQAGRLRRWFEGAAPWRVAPEQLDLRLNPSESVDRDRYASARAAAAADTELQRQYETGPFVRPDGSPVPDAQLTPMQWLLINRHYWLLTSVWQAGQELRSQGRHWSDLTGPKQERLINVYFTEHLKAHADTLIGQDSGTTARIFPWTSDPDEVVHAMRLEDRLVVVMPALLLSLQGTKEVTTRWKKGHYHLLPWDLVRLAVASFAVPLGFFASMVNRTARAVFAKNANMDATFGVRSDAGISGYTTLDDYVLKVMGRWLVGHIHIVMRAYLGRRVTRQAADLLLTHRWGRKDGSVHAHIERLRGQAETAWQTENSAAYRRLMGAAGYAALVGDKAPFFDVGRREIPTAFEQEQWNLVPDEDKLFDAAYFGPKFTSGRAAGTLIQRYDTATRDGVHIYTPTYVQWDATTGTGRLSTTPGKFLIRMPYADNPKSRLSDSALQYFQGRLTPEPVVTPAGLEERASLTVRFRDEEAAAFPEIESARRAIEDPRHWLGTPTADGGWSTGARRDEGVSAAEAMAVRMAEQALGAGSETDVTALTQIELGHDAYKDGAGLWYQLRLGLFRWLRDRYLGLTLWDGERREDAWTPGRALGWWGLQTLLAVGIGLFGGAGWAIGFLVVPWLLSIFYGTLTAVSFPGLGIQDTILQGMKGHYDGKFLQKAMDGFFKETSAAHRLVVTVDDYDHYWGRLEHGYGLLMDDPKLKLAVLIEAYARAMHPEDDRYKRFRTQMADPALVRLMRPIIPNAPATRWALRQVIQRAILDRVRDRIARMSIVGDSPRQAWLDVREALTRWLQLELAAIGNDVAGIQAHRSRDRDVFGAGDKNRQLGVDGQDPLARAMQGLGVPAIKDRTWTSYSEGTLYGGVRMPSMMYSQTTDQLLGDLIAAARAGGFLIDRMVWSREQKSLTVVSSYLASDDGKLKSVDRGRGVLHLMYLARRLTAEQYQATRQELMHLEERESEWYHTTSRMTPEEIAKAVGPEVSKRAREIVKKITGVSVEVKKEWTDKEEESVPSDAVRTQRINPLAAYLASDQDQTVNQFMLTHTHLQPDLEQVNNFLKTDSQRIVAQIPDGLTVDQANRYLEAREQRLGLPNGTFVRFQPQDQAQLTQQLRQMKATVARDGELRLSVAQAPSVWIAGVVNRWWGISMTPEWLAQRTEQARRWIMTTTLVAGCKFPLLWGITAIAWLLGLSPIKTGWATLSRWGQGEYWRRVRQGGSLFKEPYSEEVVFLSRLYGVRTDQVVRDRQKQIVDLEWSALDGLYDAASWRLAIGTYLFPGTTIARLPLWERRGLKLHAAPVPFVAALRLLEEPPWTAPVSGFNRLPTDAFELGEVFAEDTLFGWVNAHRPWLNPTMNASNVHKVNYLQAQQELRKRDEAATRAIQFFKGLGMAQATQHLFDHPMFDQARAEASAIQRLFGWDPTTQRPSGQSIFGMEAFRRDEVAAAGARGAGTLSYGYSGFTASDLFGRRVGPFAPGEVQAYWTSRYYQELDQRMGGAFFQTLRTLQRGMQPALLDEVSRDAILGGPLQDPFKVLAWAWARAAEELQQPQPPTAPPAAGMEEATTRTATRAVESMTVTAAPAVAVPPAPVLSQPRRVPVAFDNTVWTPRVQPTTAEAPAPVAAPPTVVAVTPQARAQMALDVMAAGLKLTGQDTITVAAVPVSAIVQVDPALASAAGQIIKFGSARVVIVPDDPARAVDIVVTLMGEPGTRISVRTYGGLEEAALNALETQARRAGFQVEPRQPLTGTTLGDLLRQILANLSGLEESAISDAQLGEVVNAFTLRTAA